MTRPSADRRRRAAGALLAEGAEIAVVGRNLDATLGEAQRLVDPAAIGGRLFAAAGVKGLDAGVQAHVLGDLGPRPAAVAPALAGKLGLDRRPGGLWARLPGVVGRRGA